MPDASVNRSVLSEKDKLMVLMSAGDSLEHKLKSVEKSSESKKVSSPPLDTSPFSSSAEFPSKTQTHHRTAASFAYDLVFPNSRSGQPGESERVEDDAGEILKVKNFNVKYVNVADIHAKERKEDVESPDSRRRRNKASTAHHGYVDAEDRKKCTSSTVESRLVAQDGEQRPQDTREVVQSNIVVSTSDPQPKVAKIEETEINRLRKEKQQLQSYIGSVARRMYGSTPTKDAQEQTEGCVEAAYDEQEHHIHTIHLLEQKLSALESVLDVQERCLAKNASDERIRAQSAKAGFTDMRKTMSMGDLPVDGASNIETLLKRWRTKVFELLLQSKLASETFEHERRTFHTKALTLAEKLNRAELDMEVQEQKLKAAQTEVDLMKYNLEVANQKLAILEKAKRDTEQQDLAQSKAIAHLASKFQLMPVFINSMDSLSNTVEEKLSTYANRLAFADDRTRIIRECLSKR